MHKPSETAGQPARQLTLMDLLDSRENRVHHQKELLERFTGFTDSGVFADSVASSASASCSEKCRNVTLVSMTLNIPGPVKDRPEYRRALETGLYRLKAMLDFKSILHEEFRPLITGPEGYMVIAGDPMEIKKAAIAAEEADALGRLFDMDVLSIDDAAQPDAEGHFSLTDITSMSRSQLGVPPRKCLLCGEDAKACARSRAHTMDDLLKKINEILSDAGL